MEDALEETLMARAAADVTIREDERNQLQALFWCDDEARCDAPDDGRGVAGLANVEKPLHSSMLIYLRQGSQALGLDPLVPLIEV